jgi:hypothetical protein
MLLAKLQGLREIPARVPIFGYSPHQNGHAIATPLNEAQSFQRGLEVPHGLRSRGVWTLTRRCWRTGIQASPSSSSEGDVHSAARSGSQDPAGAWSAPGPTTLNPAPPTRASPLRTRGCITGGWPIRTLRVVSTALAKRSSILGALPSRESRTFRPQARRTSSLEAHIVPYEIFWRVLKWT